MRRNTYSFIIRIWYEAVDEQGKVQTWRGSIEQVNNNKRLYFDKLDQFIDFVKLESGIDSVESTGWWRTLLAWIRP